MGDDNKGLPGCFKMGCIGCGVLVALMVGSTLFLGAVQLSFQGREPDIQRADREQALPPSPVTFSEATPESLDTAAVDGATGEIPAVDAPEMVTHLPPLDIPSDVKPGVVAVDFSTGNFDIRAGEPGEPIRVEAEYDANSFVLEEKLEENDGSWNYSVKFKSRLFGFIGGEGGDNRVTLIIPRDQPVHLVGEIGLGESDLELGGLWLHEIDLDLGIGEHRITFDEPTLEPMERFILDSSIGELDVRRLGNASPQVVRLEGGIGENSLDLRGAWQNDATIDTEFRIGEHRLTLPDDVHVEMDATRVALGERSGRDIDRSNVPEGAPTLKIRASGLIGELRID